MKRLFNAGFAILLAMLTVMPSAFAGTDQNPSGHTGTEASSSGQSTQSSFPGVIPEDRIGSNANLRSPNMTILGGDQNVNSWNGSITQWSNIPSLVLRPAGKRPTDALDTTIVWTTPTAARKITIPDAGADSNMVLSAGTQTLTATYTFSNPPTITGGLTAANIQTGSAKRELLRALCAPAGGAVTVNGTTYFANLAFNRAGTVKRIGFMTHVDPVSGTNTIKVLKNGAAGNTMLSTASVSLNGSTADVEQLATLTATGADLAVVAGDTVYCEYAAGTQGAVAKDVNVTVEFEPTDF